MDLGEADRIWFEQQERHEANDGLFQAFFDKPEFKEQMLSWLTKSLYDGIRKDSA